MNELDEEILDLREAVEIAPKNYEYCKALTMALLEAGRSDEAKICKSLSSM